MTFKSFVKVWATLKDNRTEKARNILELPLRQKMSAGTVLSIQVKSNIPVTAFTTLPLTLCFDRNKVPVDTVGLPLHSLRTVVATATVILTIVFNDLTNTSDRKTCCGQRAINRTLLQCRFRLPALVTILQVTTKARNALTKAERTVVQAPSPWLSIKSSARMAYLTIVVSSTYNSRVPLVTLQSLKVTPNSNTPFVTSMRESRFPPFVIVINMKRNKDLKRIIHPLCPTLETPFARAFEVCLSKERNILLFEWHTRSQVSELEQPPLTMIRAFPDLLPTSIVASPRPHTGQPLRFVLTALLALIVLVVATPVTGLLHYVQPRQSNSASSFNNVVKKASNTCPDSISIFPPTCRPLLS